MIETNGAINDYGSRARRSRCPTKDNSFLNSPVANGKTKSISASTLNPKGGKVMLKRY